MVKTVCYILSDLYHNKKVLKISSLGDLMEWFTFLKDVSEAKEWLLQASDFYLVPQNPIPMGPRTTF